MILTFLIASGKHMQSDSELPLSVRSTRGSDFRSRMDPRNSDQVNLIRWEGACLMKNSFILTFERGLPLATSQQKGEAVRYRRDGTAYIQHYRKDKVQDFRDSLVLRMKKYAPKEQLTGPIKLEIYVYFDTKTRSKWGKYKTTRPDCDNFKEIMDVMTLLRFWKDDAQVVDLRVVKIYSEKASISISYEELPEVPND